MNPTGFVNIAATDIHYQLIGDQDNNKPVIVFLHEGLGSIPQWKNFPEILCERTGLPGLVYERRGYGKSSPSGREREKCFLKKEGEIVLPELLEKLFPDRPHYVFGHSDGGTVALYYASLNPKNLLAAIAEAPHVFLEEISRKGIYRTQQAYLKGRLKEALDKFHKPHTEDVVMSWTNYWLHSDQKDWNMFEELSRIKKPVGFIQGDKDMFGTFQQAAEIEKRVQDPLANLLLSNCGHSPHFEKQEEVIQFCQSLFSVHSS
jgi:pimeloyl-ACP methyl ester carboxylesterase